MRLWQTILKVAKVWLHPSLVFLPSKTKWGEWEMMRGKLGQVSVRHKTNKKGLNLKAQYINKQMILIEYKTKCSGKLESKIFCLLPPSVLQMSTSWDRFPLQPNFQLSWYPHILWDYTPSGCGQRITAGNVLQSSSKLHRVNSLAMVHVVSIQWVCMVIHYNHGGCEEVKGKCLSFPTSPPASSFLHTHRCCRNYRSHRHQIHGFHHRDPLSYGHREFRSLRCWYCWWSDGSPWHQNRQRTFWIVHGCCSYADAHRPGSPARMVLLVWPPPRCPVSPW